MTQTASERRDSMISYRFFPNAGLGFRLLCLLALWGAFFSANSALAMKGFTERIVVFEFEQLNEEEVDRYSKIVIDISNKVLLSELDRAPSVGIAEFIPRNEVPPPEREEITRKMGAQHMVTGQYNFLRGNLRITGQWLDLERGRGAEEQALLSGEDLENFDIIEKKVSEFARRLLEAHYQSLAEQRQPSRRLLVTCFSGFSKRGYTPLDRFITLELPYYLSDSMAKLWVNPATFSVEGLTISQYNRECRSSLSEGFGDVRYLLSGTIIQEGEQIVVKPRLFDQLVKRPFSIASFVAPLPNAKELSDFSSRLARHIATNITNMQVQQKLQNEELYRGTIDGIMGPATWEALMKFQSTNRLPETGKLDPATMEALGL